MPNKPETSRIKGMMSALDYLGREASALGLPPEIVILLGSAKEAMRQHLNVDQRAA